MTTILVGICFCSPVLPKFCPNAWLPNIELMPRANWFIAELRLVDDAAPPVADAPNGLTALFCCICWAAELTAPVDVPPVPLSRPLPVVPPDVPLVSDCGVTWVALENAEADGVMELPMLLLLLPVPKLLVG
ncbi:hypothetical protein [Blastopirellula retiformator]|uniref:hypothetical protein n=1 Tax=Blastopirellula retiformator TaxID=2527970 RepID=UPI001FE85FE1|nr:hypothetical protein [Blastopirellula retiformator]